MEALSGFLLSLYRLARTCPVSSFQDEAFDLLAGQVKFDAARWSSSRILSNGQRQPGHVRLKDESPEAFAAYREVNAMDWPMEDLLRNRSNPIGVIAYQSAEAFSSKSAAAFRQYQRRFGHENVINAARILSSEQASHFRHMSLYRAHED